MSVKLSVGAVSSITNFTITVPSLYATSSSVNVIACGGATVVAFGRFVALPLDIVE